MEKDIIAILSERSVHFSKRQRAVADYICEHPDMAAFMTAELLAQAVGVSESTVVRFALELGFDGYPDMRRSVQQLLRSKISAQGQKAPGEAEKDYTQLFQRTVEDYGKAVSALTEGENPLSFDTALKQLQKAKKLFVLGDEPGEAPAKLLWQGLNLIRDEVQWISADPYEQLIHIGGGDALLYICPAGVENSGAARYAHDCGAAVIVLAAESLRKELAFADCFIACGKGLESDCEPILPVFAVAGAILRAFAQELKTGAKKTEKIRREYERNDRR